MRIRIITCHDVYNFGASLQAYSLQTFLQKQGHDVKIIDYIPYYFKRRLPFWYLNPSSAYYEKLKKHPLLRLVYSIHNYLDYYRKAKRRRCFDTFTKEFLRLTRRYTSVSELREDPPIADLFIAGSDQIWNSYMNNGKDDAFYLDFGNKKVCRCSYAASFGASSVDDGYKNYVREKIAKFDLISVREKSGLSILQSMGFNDAVQVLDPVFLLSSEEWNVIAAQSFLNLNRPYILVYAIAGVSSDFKNFALYLRREYQYDIVSIYGVRVPFADFNISVAGPCDFVRLISSASFVLSDSFHASAFSVVFSHPFFVFPKSSLNHSARMIDFCKMLDVPWAYAPNINDLKNKEHDWKHINEVIQEKKKESLAYLQKCISICNI